MKTSKVTNTTQQVKKHKIVLIVSIVLIIMLVIGTILICAFIESKKYNKIIKQEFTIGQNLTISLNSYCFADSDVNPYDDTDNLGELDSGYVWCCVDVIYNKDYHGRGFCLTLNYHYVRHGVATYGNAYMYRLCPVNDTSLSNNKINSIYFFKIPKNIVSDTGYDINRVYDSEQNKGLTVSFSELGTATWSTVKIAL